MPQIGRNDPCYCGSGKKYKFCHWQTDQAATRSRLNTRRARQSLFARLADFAQRPRFESDYVSAFNLFWDNRRNLKQKNVLDPFETVRFLEWHIVDYRTSHDRQRLIDMFRAQSAGYITPEERVYLGAWQSAQYAFFEVRELLAGSAVHIYDLLRDEGRDARDENYTSTMKPGDLFLARLVRREEYSEFMLSVTNIPLDEKDKLLAFAREKYNLYRDAHFGASWDEFLRESNYLFNHFVLDMRGETAQAGGKVVMPTAQEVQKTVATLSVTTAQ